MIRCHLVIFRYNTPFFASAEEFCRTDGRWTEIQNYFRPNTSHLGLLAEFNDRIHTGYGLFTRVERDEKESLLDAKVDLGISDSLLIFHTDLFMLHDKPTV
jgi:hypothetical protein